MKRIIVVAVMAITVFFVVFIYFTAFRPFTTVVFNSKHPRIEIVKKESLLFNAYVNWRLKRNGVAGGGTKPKVIGIFYTDKIRPDYKVFNTAGDVDFSATMDITEDNDVLIFIYISDQVLAGKDAEKRIKIYTVNSIRYFMKKSETGSDNVLDFIPLPIHVQTN